MENTNQKSKYEFQNKMFWSIPEKHVLIRVNKFNGKIIKTSEENEGFVVVEPWYKARLIYTGATNIDLPKIDCDDKNGEQIFIDHAITTKITNPQKYLFNNSNVSRELNILISSIIRIIAKTQDTKTLQKMVFNLPTKEYIEDPKNETLKKDARSALQGTKFTFETKKDEAGNEISAEEQEFKFELVKARLRLMDFEENYGIEVTDLYVKSIEQTKENQEAYNAVMRAEQKKKEQEIKNATELAKAQTEKQIADLKTSVGKERLKAYLEEVSKTLHTNDPAKILPYIAQIMNENNQATTTNYNINGGSSNTQDAIIAGSVIGEAGNEKKKSK